MMQADRALAFAADQNQMARADLLAKAAWALDQNKFDPAWRLFKEAEALDPNCNEAKAGIDLVQQTARRQDRPVSSCARSSSRTPRICSSASRTASRRPVERGAVDKPADPLAKADGPGDILKEAVQRQAIADQQQRRLVDDAIAEALRLVKTQPNEAHNLVKRNLDGVRTNPDLSERGQAWR